MVGPNLSSDDVAEVPGVWTKRDRSAICGRLDHVLPATFAEAAADKSNLCRAPPGAELADRVDEKNTAISPRLCRGFFLGGRAMRANPRQSRGLTCQLAAAVPALARCLQKLGHGVETFGVPRYKN